MLFLCYFLATLVPLMPLGFCCVNDVIAFVQREHSAPAARCVQETRSSPAPLRTPPMRRSWSGCPTAWPFLPACRTGSSPLLWKTGDFFVHLSFCVCLAPVSWLLCASVFVSVLCVFLCASVCHCVCVCLSLLWVCLCAPVFVSLQCVAHFGLWLDLFMVCLIWWTETIILSVSFLQLPVLFVCNRVFRLLFLHFLFHNFYGLFTVFTGRTWRHYSMP